MSEFEQWFNSEFPDADLSQHETLKGYNNLKFGWNAALSSLQGDSTCEYAKSIGTTEYKCAVKCLHNEYLPKRLIYKEIVEIMEELKLDSRKAILYDFAYSIMNKMSADNHAAKIAELKSELAKQARLLGISAERELALQAKLAEVEPVCTMLAKDGFVWSTVWRVPFEDGKHLLYTAPQPDHTKLIGELVEALEIADELIGVEPCEHVAQEAADGHRTIRALLTKAREAIK